MVLGYRSECADRHPIAVLVRSLVARLLALSKKAFAHVVEYPEHHLSKPALTSLVVFHITK